MLWLLKHVIDRDGQHWILARVVRDVGDQAALCHVLAFINGGVYEAEQRKAAAHRRRQQRRARKTRR